MSFPEVLATAFEVMPIVVLVALQADRRLDGRPGTSRPRRQD